jgi:protein Mpv17
MLETSTRPQDSSLALEQQGGLVMEAEKVLQGALVMEAEKVLGVSTASAIIGYLLFSHYDVASTQNIAHTLQHVLKAGGSQAWGSYQAFLSTNPIATKAATSATVYSIGDLIAQKTEGAEKLDAVRIARSGLAGGIGHGPLSHCWYNLSEEFFNNVIHLTAWWSFLPKIAVDQLVWGPIWNGCYILLLGLMKQESMDKMVGNVKSTTVPLFLDGLKLWPLAHCVTYGLLPVENRLLWVDLVEIFWVTILATKASSLAGDQDQSNTELLTAKR